MILTKYSHRLYVLKISCFIDAIDTPDDDSICVVITTVTWVRTTRAVSDGFFDPDTKQQSKTILDSFTGTNLIPGLEHNQNAYWIKFGGIVSILSTLTVMVHYHSITTLLI